MPLKCSFLISEFIGEFVRILLLAVVCGFLFACQGGVKPSVELSAQTETVGNVVLDSLRAKFLLSIIQPDGKNQELDAVLFSVPGKRYRMELTGPMGVGVASMLWQESGWVMTFPTEKLYARGNGYMVGLLNDKSFPLVHIHQVAGIFDGELLPRNYEVVDGGITVPEDLLAPDLQVFFGKEPTGGVFAFGKKESEVRWLCRLGRDGKMETLKYSDFRAFEGKTLPGEITFQRDGKNFLNIKMKRVTHNKAFSLGTWRLNVPRSFNQIGF